MNEEIQNLQKQIDELKRVVYKNNFSNLYVFDEQVQFRNTTIYPKNEVSISMVGLTAGSSFGRIAIKDDVGTTHYIPYY
jgi:hypothetical protein